MLHRAEAAHEAIAGTPAGPDRDARIDGLAAIPEQIVRFLAEHLVVVHGQSNQLRLRSGAAQQVGAADAPIDALAPGGVATGIPMQGTMSEFGESRLAPARVIMPGIADAAQLAASTTFLLSDDSTNINGAVLTSDGGWSAA